MKTEAIIKKRVAAVIETTKIVEAREKVREENLLPLHALLLVFYPKLSPLPEFDGDLPRFRINVENCYQLIEFIEVVELHGWMFTRSVDYPENKNRDYHFVSTEIIGGTHGLCLEAYFSSSTCRKKQIGSQPVYEMSCNTPETAPVV